MTRPIDILRRLAEGAWDWHILFDSGRRNSARPGEAYQAMTRPEEREVIKELRSEDTTDDRWPVPEYMFDKTEEDKLRRESNYRRDQMIEESKK